MIRWTDTIGFFLAVEASGSYRRPIDTVGATWGV